MFRRTSLVLLAILLLTASLNAQEPVFGLSPEEFPADAVAMPMDDPADALPPANLEAELASFSGGGVAHGGYAEGDYFGDISQGGCSSCGDCSGGCDCYCGCPPSMWRIRSSAVYMSRESSDDTLLVGRNVFTANFRPLLNAADFSFDWQTGFDISLMQGDGHGGEVELRALYLTDFDDRISGTGNDVELIFANLTPPPGGNGFGSIAPRTDPVTVTADYHSEFRTIEMNYRESFTPWWTCMIGFRYANLDDELTINTVDSSVAPGPQTSSHQFFVDNDMFGFQAGTEMILASNPIGWDLITTLKGGVYYNRVDLRVLSVGDGFTNGQLSFVTGETAWLGEATLQARRHLSCNGTLTLGYSIMSIDGVSLATQQMSTVNSLLQGPNLTGSSNRGTLFYHGANVGIEIRW